MAPSDAPAALVAPGTPTWSKLNKLPKPIAITPRSAGAVAPPPIGNDAADQVRQWPPILLSRTLDKPAQLSR